MASWTQMQFKLEKSGSSPNMEKVETLKIYEGSVEKHGLYYTKLVTTAVKDYYGPAKPVSKFEKNLKCWQNVYTGKLKMPITFSMVRFGTGYLKVFMLGYLYSHWQCMMQLCISTMVSKVN